MARIFELDLSFLFPIPFPGCNQINHTSNIPNNIFTESLNSPDNTAAILFYCLKNLGGKHFEDIWTSKETKASQIKGEKLISDLTDSV